MAESGSPSKPVATSEIEERHFPDGLPKIPFEGGCHCGAVTFKLLHEPLTIFEHEGTSYHVPISCCDCSICHKKGLLTIYPLRSDIEWKGWDELKNYRYAAKDRDHKFCGNCGSSVCIDFLDKWKFAGDVIGLNVRLIHGVDLQQLNLRYRHGRTDKPEWNDKYPV
ncbi:hypothetical protein VPNG_05001 [Cytospora leucostoma]|uniref:CENP-V/GFA domain-containing protein n=1 Tax=Cytospora leucostoma TaxID=1230097 RepID=A0A423X7Z0_9PEZI|nr:hypothetical protein VPNG_05001 [Cytospora leucostoma]